MITLHTRTLSLVLVASALLAACGDDTTGAGGSGGSSTDSTTASGGGAGGDDGTTSTTTATTTTTGGGGEGTGGNGTGGQGTGGDGTGGAGGGPVEVDLGELVINEISLDGLDWIELYNPGDVAVDLDGVRIADQDKDAPGTPKLSAAVTFTGDAALVAPGDYLFVLADQEIPGEGPQEVCDPGPAPCFHTGWGLSTGDGDIVFLVAPDDAVLLQVEIPANAALEPTTWSRLPDATGDFGVGNATPGAPNEEALPPI